MTVINCRGTSGSGKTTIVRGIMAKGTATPIYTTEKKPEAYRVDIPALSAPVFTIGSYEATCGGCDQIPTQDEICRRIRTYAGQGHVLVEGLLMGASFGRYAALDRELAAVGHHFIWAFLDTPLELCLDRVRARREERRLAKAVVPDFKPLNTKNTEDKWHDIQQVYTKCEKPSAKDWKSTGHAPTKLDARWVDHTHAVEQVYSWLT